METKVKYVLFQDVVPLKMPRTDGRDFISIGAGKDLRYDTLIWDVVLVNEGRTFVVRATDIHTGQWVQSRIPESYAKVYELDGDSGQAQSVLPKTKEEKGTK